MKKDARYESAYASDEFRKWVASMSPQERERARAAGLLSPQYDKQERWRERTDIDALPRRLAPRVEAPELEEIAVEAFESIFPDLRVYELVKRYLDGEGTLEALGGELGMTKQRFAYHVRRYQKELGLPPERFQMSEAARRKFCALRRRGHADASDEALKIRTWQAFKFARFVRETDPEKLPARELIHVAALVRAIAETYEKFRNALESLEKMNVEQNPENSLSAVESYCRPIPESRSEKNKETGQLELFGG